MLSFSNPGILSQQAFASTSAPAGLNFVADFFRQNPKRQKSDNCVPPNLPKITDEIAQIIANDQFSLMIPKPLPNIPPATPYRLMPTMREIHLGLVLPDTTCEDELEHRRMKRLVMSMTDRKNIVNDARLMALYADDGGC